MKRITQKQLLNRKFLEAEDSMAIIKSKDGVKYECHASGNGDTYSHCVEFVEIK